MWRFALVNLLRRPLRTALALVGLGLGVVGIVALVSLSQGIRASVREAADKVPGILVMARNAPSPVVSNLPASALAQVAAVPGVRAVLPEVWTPALSVEGEGPFARGPIPLVVVGMDPERRATLRGGGLYVQSLEAGRFVAPGANDEVVVSSHVAGRYGKVLGDEMEVVGRRLRIVGIYRTGADLLDGVMIVPEAVARAASGKAPGVWSCLYVEPEDSREAAAVARRIGEAVDKVEARTLSGWSENMGDLLTDLDLFLTVVASTALAVGAIGIANTMLMSVAERTREFGVLRATGWRTCDVVALVLRESVVLGAAGGVLGCGLALGVLALTAHLLPLRPVTPPWLAAGAVGLSTAIGAVGGVWPAWRAARTDPVLALRGL